MVHGCTEEAIEWTLNYVDSSNPIIILKSRHEGRLTGKGTIGKKVITIDPNLFRRTHFYVLQQMSIVFEYWDEHKEVFLRDNPRCNKSWLANEHMKKFICWLRDRISQLNTHTSEYLKKVGSLPYIHRVDAYDVTCEDKSMYYGQILEI
jgi:hypothetical protein